MIKVSNEVPVYEPKVDPPKVLDHPPIIVESHWNNDKWVVIKTPDGQSYTVNAKDLRAALENATNIRRFG